MKFKTALFLIIIWFFTGCVNNQLAGNYYKNNNYQKAYEIYYQYAKKGFPEQAYKISKLIYSKKVDKPPYLERKYALLAYKNGYKNAALYIADSYFREKNFIKALFWYKKAGFNIFHIKDFENCLKCIETIKNFSVKYNNLKRIEQFAVSRKNVKLLTVLGKFYLKKSIFYNPKQGEKYLKSAYGRGYYPAGAVLGVFYIKNKKNQQKGYEILKNIAYKNAKASYYLGNYLYNIMIKKEKQMNGGCITADFNTSKEFFTKKISIYKYNNIFTLKNIVKAYRISYRLGNKKALYKLIRLDIEDNTYMLSKKTYSGFNLKNTISFLKHQNDTESKLILAKIYETYTNLHLYPEAEKIYRQYIKINKLSAYWHLYQYEKKFNRKTDYRYLDYLANKKFVPAVIEKAYQNALNKKNILKNKKILEYYAEQNNLSALNYLGSLYANSVLFPKSKSFLYYKKACAVESKPFNIPSEDLKIAAYYNHLNMPVKFLTINYYYAQMKNKKAQLKIADFYKKHCNYKKSAYWLKILQKESDKAGEKIYNAMILLRYIPGNYKKALSYMKSQNDFYSYTVLGDIYANGYHVPFDPKKAVYYYNKAIQKGNGKALYKLIVLYQKINVNGQYNKKIISLYNKAVKLKIPNSKLRLAKFYFYLHKYNKALKIIKSIQDYKYRPKTRYLMYLITGKVKFIAGNESNYGYLLLAKAKHIYHKNPQKALYFTFRAVLCNTPNSPMLAMSLMKKINNAGIITRVFDKAKKAPACYN